MFRGESGIGIDDKGRLAIPKSYREFLTARWGAPVRLTLTVGHTKEMKRHRWLAVYPRPEWDAYQAEMRQKISKFHKDWPLVALVLGHAADVDLDRQGRFVIPPSLRTFANLGARALIVGLGLEFELWDEEKRNQWREETIASAGEVLDNPSPELLAISR